MRRILVVEDDADLVMGLLDNLVGEGYDVVVARDGETGLNLAINSSPDAIVLDLMLPGISGFEVCRSLRDRGLRMPVLILTARGHDVDKVRGLEAGADDYVTKPFSIVELTARLRALLRRATMVPLGTHVYRFADVELDFSRSRAQKQGCAVELSSLELDVMRYLIARRGEAVDRDQLLRDVWGIRGISTARSVDNLIARLRQKLETNPHEPCHILTVHRVGYKFVD